MSVCIEIRINDEFQSHSTAVSTVTAARNQLSIIKRENVKRGWYVTEEDRNSLYMEDGSGDEYGYHIVKYFTKEPL